MASVPYNFLYTRPNALRFFYATHTLFFHINFDYADSLRGSHYL